MENFFDLSLGAVSFFDFFIQISISLVLSYFLAELYLKFSISLSNKIQFSNNLIMIGVITTLIISIVKSSLALSLGLVGALSIVRFRTAIKDPEDLSYLFLSIAIGLGTGAGMIKITLCAFVIISLAIVLISKYRKNNDNQLYLSFSIDRTEDINVENLLSKFFKRYSMRRFDITDNSYDYLIEVSSLDLAQINKLKEEINLKNKKIKLSLFHDDF